MRANGLQEENVNNLHVVQKTKRADGYFDDVLSVHLVPVMAGQCSWTNAGDIAFSTTLGSCISVCAYDEDMGVGGMNHFLLPNASESEGRRFSKSFRYGSAAVENLLNCLYKNGAAKNGIKIKIFGGANIISTSAQDIGARNIAFTRDFFERENMRIKSEDVGGDYARRVIFYPQSGRVMLQTLNERDALEQIQNKETNILQKLQKVREGADVELF